MDVVPTSYKLQYQDTDPELDEEPDLDIKLGEDLPEDQQRMLNELIRRYPHVFTDMPEETDVIQHRVKLTDDDTHIM